MSKPDSTAEARTEYDFSRGTRRKYAKRCENGTNVVVLQPDIAAAFPTAEAVSLALRARLRDEQRKAGVESVAAAAGRT
jgi:hypothetical protein